jgi:PKD repeat protein
MRKLLISTGTMACLALLLSLPMHAQDQPDTLTLSGFVQNQVCVNKDFVKVTLSASASSDHNPIGFRWDLNNDGKWDTAINTDPTVIQVYPDEARFTVRVGAGNQFGDRKVSKFSFNTLRCK